MKAIKVDGAVYIWNADAGAYRNPETMCELGNTRLAHCLANDKVEEAKKTVVIRNSEGEEAATRGSDGIYYDTCGEMLSLSEYAVVLDALAKDEYTITEEYE